jgi:hypothetical protein
MQVAHRAADSVAAATMHGRGSRSIHRIRDLDREAAAIIANDLEPTFKRGFYARHIGSNQQAITEAR